MFRTQRGVAVFFKNPVLFAGHGPLSQPQNKHSGLTRCYSKTGETGENPVVD